ncbi:hypothetical protein [Polynucleobacter sp. AP-Melu-500A-A1]|uniref:hypothetical protein n=1 Tax=Polynucleobacter sp. AP-Melu-500A-A1 TaxID=2576929 RepID=UPI001C0B6000|nr:hypothetical protein [Polynucleobacter sp. AP-Melu-500A-A1]MBU3631158.1 hypothetical protein [Polynucleobacter sp. AP-Melu-500A-A1]
MSDKSNLEFVGCMQPQRSTSLAEDFKRELTQMHADQARFAKYGTNSARKAALIESGQAEKETRERFPEEI